MCDISKPKTRIVINTQGEDKELFSVRERSNGDLVILPRYAASREIDNQLIKVLGEHYSIHRSPRSDGITIKYTLDLDGDRQIDAATFFPRTDMPYAALVPTRTRPALSVERYNSTERSRDKVIRFWVPPQMPAATFFYALVVTLPGHPSIKQFDDIIVKWEDFSYFSLGMVVGFFMIPPNSGADMINFPTSIPRYDGNEEPVWFEVPAPSLADVLAQMRSSIPLLAQLTLDRNKRLRFEDGPPDVDMIVQIAAALENFGVVNPDYLPDVSRLSP